MADWIEVHTEQAVEYIRQMERRGINPAPAINVCFLHQIRSTTKNFEVGGRPSPWQPIKHPYRTTKSKNPAKAKITSRVRVVGPFIAAPTPLQNTGRLKQSILPGSPYTRSQKYKDGFEVGTNVEYAGAHQYGSAGGQTIKPKEKKALRFVIGGEFVFAKHVTRGDIPARPFLVFLKEDIEFHERTLLAYLERGNAGNEVIA